MAPNSGSTGNRNTETKRERFKRLAEARTRTILSKLKVLGNCANRAAYEYTSEDVKKIFKAIRERVSEIEDRFSETCGRDDFKL
jgi:gas vesicle protein